MPSPRARRTLRLAAAATALILVAGTVPAQAGNGGFTTGRPKMLVAGVDRPDVTTSAILTVGDVIEDDSGSFMFDALPDGISMKARGKGRADLYINHETSLVPFPWAFTGSGTAPARPTVNNSQNDFDNAQVSRVALNQRSAGVLHGEFVITSGENFQRFCSNYLATAAEGFDREILFTNEEATDFVYRTGVAWPVAPGTGDQAGLVVAHDIKSGQTRAIPGMGRHNHENAVPIPGFSELIVLSGDDTFTTHPAQSQVYAYIAADADAVWNDEGVLYGFRADDYVTYNDYYDIVPGSTEAADGIPGELVEINETDAKGNQTALENASDAAGVFSFVRIEDIAYDKRPGQGNVVYLVDSGRGRLETDALDSPPFRSTNGRIWKMVLDPTNPRNVLSLSILIEGDDNPVKTVREMHQPDNIESTPRSLLFTEDPGSSQQFVLTDTDSRATTARIWRYDLATGDMEIVAAVDQSQDEQGTDEPISPTGRKGAWEATGIIDASAVFGPGAFLVNVQAHTLWIDAAPGPDAFGDPSDLVVANRTLPDGHADWTYKREGGQLLLIRIPGA